MGDMVDSPDIAGSQRGFLTGFAHAMGWTEGQASMLAVGLVVVAFSTICGIVPAVRSGWSAIAPTRVAQPNAAPPVQPGIAASPPSGSSRISAPWAPQAPSATSNTSHANGEPPPASTSGDKRALGVDAGRLFVTVSYPGAVNGLAVAANGDVFVTAGGNAASAVLQFGSSSDLRRTYELVANGVSFKDPTALAIGRQGMVLVLTRTPAAVLRIDPSNGSVERVASIPDLPPCIPIVRTTDCEPANTDHPPLPAGAAFDSAGNLFITDAGQQSIWRVAAGDSTPQQWLSDSSFWSALHVGGPTGIALAPSGSLVFVVSATGIDGTGAVFDQTIDSDGHAGTRRKVASLPADSGAAGLALDPASSLVYVSESALNTVAVLDDAGAEVARLPSSGVTVQGPAGLSFRDGALLVTSQPNGSEPGRVVEINRRIP